MLYLVTSDRRSLALLTEDLLLLIRTSVDSNIKYKMLNERLTLQITEFSVTIGTTLKNSWRGRNIFYCPIHASLDRETAPASTRDGGPLAAERGNTVSRD